MSIKELMTRELAPGVDSTMAGRRMGTVMFAIGGFMLALGALKIPRMGLGCLLGVMLKMNCFILGLLWPKESKTDNFTDGE